MKRVYITDQHRPYLDLLDRVAISAREDHLAYQRIRAQINRVREWFSDRTGWSVICNRELARLVKTPSLLSSGHGFSWTQSPLDYELFTWVMWYAENSGSEQFLLSQLIEEIEVRANELIEPGHINWDIHAHRLSLNRALRGLEQSGIVRRIDGDIDGWVHSRNVDLLYEFTQLARYMHVYLPAPNASIQPVQQQIEAMERDSDLESTAMAEIHLALSEMAAVGCWQPQFASNTGASAQQHSPILGCGQAGQRLYRTLLLSPALYPCADPEAFAILQGQDRRHSIAADLRDTLGWDLEVTPSYACLLRPSASEASEQALFPFRAGLAHVILLLCGKLHDLVQQGEQTPDEYDRLRVTPGVLTALITQLRVEHGSDWGTGLRELGVQSLVGQVIETMIKWDMIFGPDADGQLYILPLAARFKGAYVAAM